MGPLDAEVAGANRTTTLLAVSGGMIVPENRQFEIPFSSCVFLANSIQTSSSFFNSRFLEWARIVDQEGSLSVLSRPGWEWPEAGLMPGILRNFKLAVFLRFRAAVDNEGRFTQHGHLF